MSNSPPRTNSDKKVCQKTPSGTTKKKNKQRTPKSNFNHKAQQAALLESANWSQVKPIKSRNQAQGSQDESEISSRSFLLFNVDTPQPGSIQTHIVDPEGPGQPQHIIYTSNDPTDFMITSPESPLITNITTPPPNGQQNIFGTIQDDLSRSTKRINRVVEKIQTNKNSPTKFKEMNQSAIETSAIISIKKPEIISLDSSNSSQNATIMDCEQQHSQQALSNKGL